MPRNGEKKFEEFIKKYGESAGDEVMERIADAMWDQKGNDRLRINNFHKLNACNHVADGDIEHNGEWFSFSIEAGDWNGTVIHDWGDFEDVAAYKPEKPTIYDLMPRNHNLEIERPHMFKLYLLWREEAWFKKLSQSYNYDRYFSPGVNTENHWRGKASERGLIYAPSDDVRERIAVFNSPDFEVKQRDIKLGSIFLQRPPKPPKEGA